MPGSRTHSWGRGAIYNWRVKAGKKEVFSDPKKQNCKQYIMDHKGKLEGVKLRLIEPNW